MVFAPLLFLSCQTGTALSPAVLLTALAVLPGSPGPCRPGRRPRRPPALLAPEPHCRPATASRQFVSAAHFLPLVATREKLPEQLTHVYFSGYRFSEAIGAGVFRRSTEAGLAAGVRADEQARWRSCDRGRAGPRSLRRDAPAPDPLARSSDPRDRRPPRVTGRSRNLLAAAAPSGDRAQLRHPADPGDDRQPVPAGRRPERRGAGLRFRPLERQNLMPLMSPATEAVHCRMPGAIEVEAR